MSYENIISSAGGIIAICVGVISWIANRSMDIKILDLKSQISVDEDRQKRISNTQFDLYVRLWAGLLEVKVASDDLWQKASDSNLATFSELYEKSSKLIEEARLVISEDNYERLLSATNALNQFEDGKNNLRELRRELRQADNEGWVQEQINHNRSAKTEFDRVMQDIVEGFRRDLGLVYSGRSGKTSDTI